VKTFGFSAREKLKSRKQIGKVFESGRYFHAPPLRISWLLEADDTGVALQAGVGASGKYFKKAVDRNRIKRILREAWRLQKLPLKQTLEGEGKYLSVFIIYTGKVLPQYTQIYETMGKVIDQLIQHIHEDPSSGT
jgi:ribonuclease P protein component